MDHTIVDYLKEERASFLDAPLNDVDSLILSSIVYFSFEKGAIGHAMPSEIMPLPVALCGVLHEELLGRCWLSHMGGEEFLAALLTSPRFMELNVGFYANETSSHFEKQFAAITFYLPDDSVYVAFRGTDNSLNGWKEDFNLTFMQEIPSQIRARAYLEGIADARVSRLFVGGHSKGGNLAEYTALTCRKQSFDKIESVFSHDGPGFAFTPSDRIETDEYRQKLRKTVPESSVFGMMMESRNEYRVVGATGVLFAQHAPTNWVVFGGNFVTLERVSADAEILANTINSWARTYDPETRALFIDAVYELLCAAGVDTWSEFAEHKSGNAIAVAAAAAKLPADLRSQLLGMLRDIAPIFGAAAAGRLFLSS